MTRELIIDEGFNLVKLENDTTNVLKYERAVNSTFIQMHFCIKNNTKLHFGPHYSLDIKENNSLLLYNPNQSLPINLSLEPGSKQVILIIAIKVFHSFFSQVADLIHFLDDDNKDKKYYLDKELTPSEILVLNQICNDNMHESLQKLYTKGKVFELLSLYFNKNEDSDQSCPFLDDEENVDKIKKVKQIVISNMSEPPSLHDLAKEVGLTLPKLNDGFKHIYGDSIFNFLLDYKLEYARKMLLSKKHNVSEISLQVGYSTASHFIAAFKKKYGTTPKQYMMSL
jgi:AraC-like DNA-binding protein